MRVLEILNRLEEAKYWTDKIARQRAENFYDDLHAFLDVDEKILRRRLLPAQNGKFTVMAKAFCGDAPSNLVVVFTAPNGKFKGGVGKMGAMDALVLAFLLKPDDLTYLATRVQKDVVVHEMIHVLDPGRREGNGSARALDAGGRDSYFNSPSEWNAFWQEGAAQLERMLRNKMMQNPDVFDTFFGDGSLRAMQGRAGKFWDDEFLDAMNAKTRRKFDKRLAALWSELRDQGLLGAP
jgi:hypothetical protein